jgi:DNA-binding phage protein
MKNAKIKAAEYNDDALIKKLRNNPKALRTYITYIAKEFDKDRDIDVFLGCLKVAIMASRGTATQISKIAKIDRSGIYKALSNNTRPRIDTFLNILNGVGLDIKIKLAA